jgi:hypothetical protein
LPRRTTVASPSALRACATIACSSQIQATTTWPNASRNTDALASVASQVADRVQPRTVQHPRRGAGQLARARRELAPHRPSRERGRAAAVDRACVREDIAASPRPSTTLRPEQVERLDAVGALVDRIEPVVAPELLDRVVSRVPVAAVHLDRQVVRARHHCDGQLLTTGVSSSSSHFARCRSSGDPVASSSTSRAPYRHSARAPST